MKKQKLNKDLLGFYFYKYKWYALCFTCIFIVSLITGKFVEALFFMLGFTLFRYVFPSTLHLDDFKECILLSIILLSTGVAICVNKNLSIYSSIIISFVLCLTLYILDYVVLLLGKKSIKHNRDKIIEILNSDVSLDHIKEHCKKHGIKEYVAITIDNFLRMTIEQVCQIEYLTETAVKKRIRCFIEKSVE